MARTSRLSVEGASGLLERAVSGRVARDRARSAAVLVERAALGVVGRAAAEPRVDVGGTGGVGE